MQSWYKFDTIRLRYHFLVQVGYIIVLISFWYNVGPRSVQAWFKFSTSLVQGCYNVGTMLVPYDFDYMLVPVWCEFATILVHFDVGFTLVPCWYKFGTSVVQV